MTRAVGVARRGPRGSARRCRGRGRGTCRSRRCGRSPRSTSRRTTCRGRWRPRAGAAGMVTLLTMPIDVGELQVDEADAVLADAAQDRLDEVVRVLADRSRHGDHSRRVNAPILAGAHGRGRCDNLQSRLCRPARSRSTARPAPARAWSGSGWPDSSATPTSTPARSTARSPGWRSSAASTRATGQRLAALAREADLRILPPAGSRRPARLRGRDRRARRHRRAVHAGR